jgi:hypothetical protein
MIAKREETAEGVLAWPTQANAPRIGTMAFCGDVACIRACSRLSTAPASLPEHASTKITKDVPSNARPTYNKWPSKVSGHQKVLLKVKSMVAFQNEDESSGVRALSPER